MLELSDELRDALNADDAQEFMELLQRRHPRDVRALQALITADPAVPSHYRTKALYALGWWGDPSVVPMIRRVLPQLDERGRIGAVSALGNLGTAAAVSEIAEHVTDRSEQVRKTAVLALRRVASAKARQKLREVASTDPVKWVRELAAHDLD